jgi:hypothetical protein
VWGDLTVASEAAYRYYTAKMTVGALDFPATGFPGPFPPSTVDQAAGTQNLASRSLGVYISASYQLSSLPGAWKRLSACGAFNWDRSTDTYKDTSSYVRAAAIALRYDIVDHFLVKAEFERVQETDKFAAHTYGNIFSLKTTFDF